MVKLDALVENEYFFINETVGAAAEEPSILNKGTAWKSNVLHYLVNGLTEEMFPAALESVDVKR